jgi:replicative DNA helicase
LEKGDKTMAEESILKLANSLRRHTEGSKIIRSSVIDDSYLDYYLSEDEQLISFGLRWLDKIFGGGASRGDLILWQGGTGRGKSIALLDQAVNSAEAGYNVALVTVELSLRKQQNRFVARATNTLYQTVKSRQLPIEFIQELNKKYSSMKNKFEIIDVPINCSTEIIRLELEEFVEQHGKLDVIVVDPVYMIKALTNSESSWEEKGTVLLELKQIAEDFHSVMHTANQIKNKDLNKLDPDTDSASQSFLYPAGCDGLINIVMTDEMRNKKIARIKVPKAREGESGAAFYILTAYEKMIFCQQEIADPSSVLAGEDKSDDWD